MCSPNSYILGSDTHKAQKAKRQHAVQHAFNCKSADAQIERHDISSYNTPARTAQNRCNYGASSYQKE